MTMLTDYYRDSHYDYHREVGMGEAARLFWSNYAAFEGRSNRGEYWWWALAAFFINMALTAVDMAVLGSSFGDVAVLSSLWALVTFLPNWALCVRRLHDINRSGWWLLLSLIPVVGIIVLLVWMATRGDGHRNRFG